MGRTYTVELTHQDKCIILKALRDSVKIASRLVEDTADIFLDEACEYYQQEAEAIQRCSDRLKIKLAQ